MTTPYPTDNDRSQHADPLDRTAGGDALDRPSNGDSLDRSTAADHAADGERPAYTVDQVGDDQAPLDTVTDPVTYPADVEPAGNDHVSADTADTAPANAATADPGSTNAVSAGASAAPTGAATSSTSADEPLVPSAEAVDFKARWDVVQQGFVDDPRTAVTDADKLVSDVLERLSATFDQQHRDLEGQWSDGEPSTEDLRSALQKYRAFFQRLLTI
ncbi:hypothetical protein [Kribbella sp. CA-293567]|uniref:hypothetical protein n=1 Tax=Kribbella sp. CA-293567 TaxID=3002436 RepID=UPI0022DE6A78|nr:hypothetical protein [Kribbella sp. CA-293567]WBQ07831.1 hypothetical protein OX958_13770 [Kribbella sp. CA-293567]